MRSAAALVIIVFVVLAVFILNNLFFKSMASAEKIILIADDGQKISANFYNVPEAKGWILLTHMMPATKESWDSFAQDMQKFGYASVAIDLRGHGESQGGPGGYNKFTDAEHEAGILDLESAWNFLKSRGAVPETTTIIGSSIGANLSMQFLERHAEIAHGVLLSAGLNYHGVKTEEAARKISISQSIVLVSSKDDDGNAGENQLLYDVLPEKMNKHLIIFEQGGHGNSMFLAIDELDLTAAIKKFLEYGSIN